MTFTSRLALALCAVALVGAPAAAQETIGVSSAQTSDLEVVEGSDLAKYQAKTLGEDVQAALGISDPVAFAYVGFVYTGGPRPFEVEGLVLDVGDDLRIERYELFEIEPLISRPGDTGLSARDQALWLADHDRSDSDERRVIEVRGGRILILSGEATRDAAAVNAIRPLAWAARGSDWPVNLLSIQEGFDDMAFAFDAEGAKHPSVQRADELLGPAQLDTFRAMGATVTETPEGVRIEQDSVLVAERRLDAEGNTTLTLSETIDGERELVDALATLSAANPGAAPTTTSNGASGLLGGAFGD